MRRLWIFLCLLVLSLAACRLFTPGAFLETPTPGAQSTQTPLAPTPTSTPLPRQPTSSPVPLLAHPVPVPEESFAVRTHPDGGLYVGDLVSLEIIAPKDFDLEGQRVQVEVDAEPQITLGPVDFGRFGIGGRSQATLLWSWDTSGLQADDYNLTFTILPDGHTWMENISLLPEDQVPAPEPQAQWAIAETECCLIHYITGTAAERDLHLLQEIIDQQAYTASQRMQVELDQPIEITFLPRVLGHGGFASGDISVSYLDRNYAGDGTEIVLHHEMVHILDGRLGGDLRPTLLVEGVAVYLSGGHFKPELLMPRAAALLEPPVTCIHSVPDTGSEVGPSMVQGCSLSQYLPLPELIDNFYFSQHEIGYLQAGALVEFMVDTWGWQAFSDFYRNIKPIEDGSQSEAMDAALQVHLGLSLEELEAHFVETLREQPVTPDFAEDVRLTVSFYDTVRRYQRMLDPSAYFLTAWLPGNEQMRERGIVADYLRHPSAPENLALESMLVAADAYLRSGDFERTQLMLDSVNAVLDVFSTHSLDLSNLAE